MQNKTGRPTRPAARQAAPAQKPVRRVRSVEPQRSQMTNTRLYWLGGVGMLLAITLVAIFFLARPGQNTTGGSGGNSVNDHISVQHILIGFKDAVGFGGNAPPKAQTRTQEQARTLAYEILDRARAGENFDALVSEYTDDSAPGIYNMATTGVTPAEGEYPREGMVGAFGNVGFNLQVGEIGIADYDPATSPFGWHIIKRLK